MSPMEADHFWANVFAAHATRLAEAEAVVKSPHLHHERFMQPGPGNGATGGANQWQPSATAPGADPLLPEPVTAFERPIEPLKEEAAGLTDPTSEEALEDRTRRQAFLHEVTMQLVRYGAQYVRTSLRNMGYTPSEAQLICKEARLALAEDHLHTDVEEHRAISIARLERIYRQADDSMDPKVALATQKHLDRVTGVTRDDGAGALGEIAELAKLVCINTMAPPSVERILDAEVIDSPVKPRVQVLTDDEIAQIEAERKE